jgi:hypothetical protein
VAGALVIVVVAKRSAPTADLTPGAPPPAALPVDAAASADSERGEASAAPARKETKAAVDKEADDPRMGTLILPARASGHRIFVDGRRAKTEDEAEGIAPLRLRCGQHEIQIGSAGMPETIDLPCGGEVQIQ